MLWENNSLTYTVGHVVFIEISYKLLKPRFHNGSVDTGFILLA